MGHGIHGVGHGGASADSSYYSDPVGDGTAGSSAADQPLPQEEPTIDIPKIISTWWNKLGSLQLFGCQSPFSSGPARPIPQPPPRSVPQWSVKEVAKSQWMNISGIIVPYGSKDVTESVHEKLGMILIQIPTDFRYEGIPVSQGVAFFYQDNRQLAKFTLSEDFELTFKIEGQEYSSLAFAGQLVELHQSGIPEPVVLHQKLDLDENQFAEGSSLWFSKTDQLISGRANPGTIIQGYPVIDAFEFHENNQLKKFKLADDTIIQGIKFKRGTVIHLDEQNRLSYVEIEKDHRILGKNYPTGTSIQFNQAGQAVKSWKTHKATGKW